MMILQKTFNSSERDLINKLINQKMVETRINFQYGIDLTLMKIKYSRSSILSNALNQMKITNHSNILFFDNIILNF